MMMAVRLHLQSEKVLKELGIWLMRTGRALVAPAFTLFPVATTMNQVSLIQLQCIVSITSTNIIFGGL